MKKNIINLIVVCGLFNTTHTTLTMESTIVSNQNKKMQTDAYSTSSSSNSPRSKSCPPSPRRSSGSLTETKDSIVSTMLKTNSPVATIESFSTITDPDKKIFYSVTYNDEQEKNADFFKALQERDEDERIISQGLKDLQELSIETPRATENDLPENSHIQPQNNDTEKKFNLDLSMIDTRPSYNDLLSSRIQQSERSEFLCSVTTQQPEDTIQIYTGYKLNTIDSTSFTIIDPNANDYVVATIKGNIRQPISKLPNDSNKFYIELKDNDGNYAIEIINDRSNEQKNPLPSVLHDKTPARTSIPFYKKPAFITASFVCASLASLILIMHRFGYLPDNVTQSINKLLPGRLAQ